MKKTPNRLEVWFKIVLMGLLALLYVMARSYPQESRQFPQLIAIFTLLVLVISLVLDFLWKKKASPPESVEASDTGFQVADQENGQKEKKRRLYLTWGMIIISTGIGFLGGFLITTFLLFIGFALFFGGKEHLLRNALTAIGVTAVIYVIFEWILRVSLLGI